MGNDVTLPGVGVAMGVLDVCVWMTSNVSVNIASVHLNDFLIESGWCRERQGGDGESKGQKTRYNDGKANGRDHVESGMKLK